MADAAPLTMRELRGLTPRELEDLATERGHEIPERATSSDVRQLLAGRGGTLTTVDVPSPGAAGAPVAEGQVAVVEAALNRLGVDDLRKVAEDFDLDVVRSDGSDGKPRKEDYVEAVLHGSQIVGDGRQVDPEAAGNQGPEPSDAAKAAVEEGAGDVRPDPIPGEPAGEPATAPAAAADAAPAQDDNLDDVTKPVLQDLAQRSGVEFKSRTTADELRKALREKGVVRAPSGG